MNEFSESFGDTVEREMRLRNTPVSLLTNCRTGESISPTGRLSDEDVAELERVRRDALERYRRS